MAFGNNFYVDFYVDEVPTPMTIGDRYAGIQGADMTVGASRTYTMDLPIASYIFTSGTHQLYAQVDTDNSVDECPHEDNNVFGPITISATGLSQDNADNAPVEHRETGPRMTPTPMLPANEEADEIMEIC